MKANPSFRPIPLILLIILISSACSLSLLATPSPQSNSTQEMVLTLTVDSPENTVTSIPGPSCLTLQDLNFRFGPGTAYRPPIKVIPGNSVVVPLGYNVNGIPGGRWVFVQDPVSQEKGWISAGEQYVSCNLDLTSLPLVDAGTPPPPPLPRSAISSTPDGTCGLGLDYDCQVIFLDESFVQFKVLKDGREIGENDGVNNVSFTVTKNGETVYSHVENNVPYCIFGGDGPCNSWVVEDDVYKWEQGGATVEEGRYHVSITATVNDDVTDSEGNIPNLHWDADVTVTLP